jgi:hypothetical protein
MILMKKMRKASPILKCDACGQPIGSKGCTTILVLCNNKAYQRVAAQKACKDCLVKRGQFHHIGCEEEICPACGALLCECACVVNYF